MKLDIQPLAIPDVKLIKTTRFGDARGYFAETYARPAFVEHGLAH